MKTFVTGFALLILFTNAAMASESCQLRYRWKPGHVWQSEVTSQYKSSTADIDAMPPTRYVVRYKVKKGKKSGWVKLEAKYISHSAQSKGGMDYTKLTFTADMHSSGELRRIAHKGSAMPPVPKEQLAGMPPQYRTMMQQSNDTMAKAMQKGVFWFPELPEDRLTIGESFETVDKSDLGSSGMMQMQSVTKTEYTLEDISEGLAYFSVRQRSQTKSKSMGGNTETRVAGKADAIFDLKQGMWVEMTTKMQISGSYGGMAGMGGNAGGMQVSRYRMQRQ